jgi:type VI secretion system ImpC/EvpB family protein
MVAILRNRLTEMGIKLPDEKVEQITTLTEAKLRSFDEAICELIRHAIQDCANFGDKNLDEFLAAVIGGLKDRKNALKSAILAHPDFRALESNHAVVEEQVFQEDGQGLLVRVINVTPEDLRKDLADAGLAEQSKFYTTVVAAEYHRPGGQPNRIVHWLAPVGPNDVDIIEPMLAMGHEAHFALITTVLPEVVCPVDDPEDPPRDFSTLPQAGEIISEYRKLENAPLHGLQQTPQSTKLLLAVGRANARRPYHPKTNPCPSSSQFRETNDDPLRVPAGLLAAKSIARSYTEFGSGSRIAGVFGGGKHTRASVIRNGEVMSLDCIINEPQEESLKKCGLWAALPWKRKDYAVAFDSVSAFVPVPTGDARKDADAVLASKLAYSMLSIEYGHMLKKELRYCRGLTVNCQAVATIIEEKLKAYVTPDLNSASQESLARKPLESVSVTVTMPKPGVFLATATITPHILLAGAHVTLKIQAQD